ncbi:hypothetical protein [Mycolicibacterium baixiangningiae]|uniref:hypothetical protein n=1 Tax=Mycolicibacterium baixiangningiae TaxID=2761578 RepID=UPI0018694305|nr:hypothetical protein [Mycolicibacterium baixiangningiae]
MPAVYPADVVTLTTEGDGTALAVAEQIVPLVTAMAKAYTRGRGFHDNGEPFDDVAAAIATACARFMGNPKQALEAQTMGPFTRDHRSRGFEGWTLAEQSVLNRYRKRAM